MLNRKENNSGMSLIEVIVSMLVLSIAVVTVMTAFSMATKVNVKTKQIQGTESLMESLIEYAEAGGTDFKGWFEVEPANYTFTDSGTVKEEMLKRVEEGFNRYTVKVTTDTAPAEYSGTEMNAHKVIQFGGAGCNTVLLDVSSAADDDEVHEMFWGLHEIAVNDHNTNEYMIEQQQALLGITYVPDIRAPKSKTEIAAGIDREIILEAYSTGTDKMRLKVSKVYELKDTSFMFPVGASRIYTKTCEVTNEYDSRLSANPAAKRLNQIYLMYPDFSGEGAAYRGLDLRILDPDKLLSEDIKLFVVKQVETSMTNINNVVELTIDQRYNAGDAIYISCKKADGTPAEPVKLQLYSSVLINTGAESFPSLEIHNNDLVATGSEVRIVKVKVELFDEGEVNLLASKEITRLQ